MSPKVRELLYKVGVAVFAALTLLTTFHIVDTEAAGAIGGVVTALLGLFGVTISGTAAINITKQRKDGAFEDTPTPAGPADQIVNGVQEVLAQQKAAVDEIAKAQQALTDLAGTTLGPLATAVLSAGKVT